MKDERPAHHGWEWGISPEVGPPAGSWPAPPSQQREAPADPERWEQLFLKRNRRRARRDVPQSGFAPVTENRQARPTPRAPLDEEGEVLGSAGYSPSGLPRRQRRAQTRAARNEAMVARRARFAQRKAAAEADRHARKQAGFLPAAGEPGPKALRSPRRLRIEAHRATSEVLSVAYPFLAEAGMGSDGILVGHDSWSGAAFVYDPWVLYQRGGLTNPNVLLAGVIGRGKSCLAKSLTTRSIAFGRRVYVPGDPKGEWSTVADAAGGRAISLGTGHKLNPLDDGPRPAGLDNEDWYATVSLRRLALLGSLTEQALGRALRPVEHTALAAALEQAVRSAGERRETPILPLVVDALLEPTAGHRGSSLEQLRGDGRDPGHALARLVHGDLAGLFDAPSTVRFDPDLPMVSLDLSAISGSDTLIALVMTCASAWMEAALADPTAGPRWLVYDEAWRLMRQPALLARMQAQWKLSRALGIANLLIIHRLSDLDAVGETDSAARNLALGLLADCSTRIIYRQERGEAEKTGATIGLSSTEIAQLPDLDRGEGLWRIGERAFVVRHKCTSGELVLFDTSARMSV